MTREQNFILYNLLSKDTASILISRSYTSIRSNSKVKNESATGLLIKTSLEISTNNVANTLYFLQNLQDNLKEKRKEFEKEVVKMDKNFLEELKYKYRKPLGFKVKDLDLTLIKSIKPKKSKKKVNDSINKK